MASSLLFLRRRRTACVRCFDAQSRVRAERPQPQSRRAAPARLSDRSGAISVGGILAPIKGAPVTSLFGMRFHPILHILRLHAGIDFGARSARQCAPRLTAKWNSPGRRWLRQSRPHSAQGLRDLLFAPLGHSRIDKAGRRSRSGGDCRPIRQQRPLDRSASAFRVLSQRRRGRSLAAFGRRGPGLGGNLDAQRRRVDGPRLHKRSQRSRNRRLPRRQSADRRRARGSG